MFSIERWQEIFEAIGKNKLRTFLTGISVASGIFILVILLSVGKGLENGVEKQFENDAAGIIELWPGTTTVEYKGLNPGREIQLHNSDYDLAVQKYDAQLDKKSATITSWNAPVVYGKETGNYVLRGAYPDHQYIENISVTSGRFFNDNDVAHCEKAAVIGQKMNSDLFKGENPIGEMLMLNSIPFKVIGVFTDPAGEREESRAYIPISTSQKVFGNADKISNLSFVMKKTADYDEALAKSKAFSEGVSQLIKSKNAIAPNDEGAMNVHNSIEDAKKFYDINTYISGFFWWVGIMTIIAGVVGVSNIMLIIVKERTKEIGIRKALGASPAAIIGMILHESIFITTISGFVGLLSSLILLEIAGPMIKSDYFLNPQVNFNVAFITLLLLVFSGTLAGFFPAYRAAKIKPIIALRAE